MRRARARLKNATAYPLMTDKPSKSAQKREAKAIEALGERLLSIPAADLATLPLDDELREIVLATRDMRARSALRRQRLFLARQLRQRDLDALRAALAALDRRGDGDKRRFHEAERWRDRLLAEGDAALNELQQATGRELPRVAALLAGLRPTLPEAQTRRLQRDIFRAIHDELAR